MGAMTIRERIGHIRVVWIILAAVLIWYFAC